jgi:hypothetical protein
MYTLGDYLFGMLLGAVTALVVRVIVWPGLDMVIAMLIGMAVGIVLHLLFALVLAPVLGLFESMISGSLVGMYGGMLFAMRDSMAAGSATLLAAVSVGAGFGALVVVGMKVYDAALRGTVLDAEG